MALVRRLKREWGSGASMARWRETEQSSEQNVNRQFNVFSEEVALSAQRYPAGEEAAPPRTEDGRQGEIRGPIRDVHKVRGIDHDRFFLAERGLDGTYTVNLTEPGMVAFETALGIANDFGANTLISPYSTIADVMERNATREELSAELRRDRDGVLQWLRRAVLKRKLRGSENPSRRQRTISHIGKTIIVLLFVYWTLQQFAIVLADIRDIPGLLTSLPQDILNPTAGTDSIGAKFSDAYTHLILGVVGAHLIYLVAKLIRPLTRIYRKDQLVSGERFVLSVLDWLLKKLTESDESDSVRARA
jgi:hypothetical protein